MSVIRFLREVFKNQYMLPLVFVLIALHFDLKWIEIEDEALLPYKETINDAVALLFLVWAGTVWVLESMVLRILDQGEKR